MAERALPPGAIRRRAFFGLLDADGWSWAGLKATFWFVVMLFLLGYLPDRAYYFTVFPTIDVGANIISPVNFCDPSNRTLDCPAPPGAVVPWDPSPPELALPQGRAGAATAQSGTNLYLVGGAVGEAATESVLATQVSTEGNFARWAEGPPLPEPRAEAAVVSFSGVPYIIGGLDESGQATDTVFVGTVEEGVLQGWEASEELKLPAPLAGAGAVAAANGIWLVGGRQGDQPVASVYLAGLDTEVSPPQIGAWDEVAALPLPEPRADAGTIMVAGNLFVIGGETAAGVTNTIARLQLDDTGEPVKDPATGQPRGWATSQGAQSMPELRSEASVFTANGAIYVAGGRDAQGAATETLFWALPDSSGNIPEWRRLAETDLPAPRADAAPVVVGSFVFLVSGEGEGGAPTPESLRASLAPKAPFFRLGLIGATLPGLSIQGEIGQQLGYINAFGLGMTNFVILVLVGYGFSHPRGARRVLERLTRGRYRAPPEDPYSAGD